MDNERPGKYHKDRFKAKPWYEVPLEGAEPEAAQYRFLEEFGHRQWRFDPLAYLKWENVLRFERETPIFELQPVATELWLWAIPSRSLEVFRAPVADLRAVYRTHKLEGWYFSPESFEWCICGTWDFQYWVCDPRSRFSESRLLGGQAD